jgi:hypothetical protein
MSLDDLVLPFKLFIGLTVSVSGSRAAWIRLENGILLR